MDFFSRIQMCLHLSREGSVSEVSSWRMEVLGLNRPVYGEMKCNVYMAQKLSDSCWFYIVTEEMPLIYYVTQNTS